MADPPVGPTGVVDARAARLETIWGHYLTMDLGRFFPCLEALRKIGKPSTQPILSQLSKHIPSHRRLMFTTALLGIEGGKVSEFLLKEELADAKSKAARSRLQQSLDMLERLRGDSADDSGDKEAAGNAAGQRVEELPSPKASPGAADTVPAPEAGEEAGESDDVGGSPVSAGDADPSPGADAAGVP